MINGRLDKFLQLSNADKLLVLNALLLLQVNWLLVRIRPFEQLRTSSRPGDSNKPMPAERTNRILSLVESASRAAPWTDNCLLRGLTGLQLMEKFGTPANLSIGVKREADGTIQAHAWLECADGRPLSDELIDIADYQRLKISAVNGSTE